MEKKQLKRLDLEKGIFEANGKTYHIEGGLSIERYCEFQLLEKEMGYGTTFKAMFENHKKLYGMLNKQRFADCAIEVYNMMKGIAKLEEREPTILKICALFINTPEEDRESISQDLITQKIQDWKAEGLDMRDFFHVASASVNGFLEIYRTVTRIISGEETISEA